MADFICILCKLPKPDWTLLLEFLFSTLHRYKNRNNNKKLYRNTSARLAGILKVTNTDYKYVNFLKSVLERPEGARRSNFALPPSDALLPSRRRGAESCTTNEGLPGTCEPQFECPAKRTSNGGRTVAPTICKNHAFFVVVCCPSDDLPPRSSNPLDKLKIPNCGKKQLGTAESLEFRQKRSSLSIPRDLVTIVPSVVGGKISQKNGWPWMAAIFTKRGSQKTYLCGGTIINDRYIVSAAHCFKKSASSRIVPERYVIRLAEHDITDNNNGQEYDVEEIIVHSEYKPPVAYHDIALLKKKSVTVIGWGTTAFAGADSPKLREASIPVTSNTHCNESYIKIRAFKTYPQGITPNIICAGEITGGKDACQGDSGGPLMILDQSRKWTLVGVVSGGFQCARPGFPGVYTRVTEYLNWIAQNLD
ncbi:Clotting factor B [Nymphon striatum]|nr:Clotting factor B [Nymphon striatum]